MRPTRPLKKNPPQPAGAGRGGADALGAGPRNAAGGAAGIGAKGSLADDEPGEAAGALSPMGMSATAR